MYLKIRVLSIQIFEKFELYSLKSLKITLSYIIICFGVYAKYRNINLNTTVQNVIAGKFMIFF